LQPAWIAMQQEFPAAMALRGDVNTIDDACGGVIAAHPVNRDD
jgi:hypothetical protein